MRTNEEYWRERQLALEELTYAGSIEAAARIKAEYNDAMRAIDREFAAWYHRYADAEGITYAEAKRRLSPEEIESLQMDVEEYIQKGRLLQFSPEFQAELEAASTAHHVDRLRDLQIRTRYRIEVATGMEMKTSRKALEDAYKERYFREAYEIQLSRRGGERVVESHVAKQLRQVLKRPWTTDRRSFSERIWDNRARLVNSVLTELTQGIIAGRSMEDISKALEARMGAGFSNAYRLVRTETAHFAEEATYDCYRDLAVERYQILATLDDRTSEICQDMDGQVFKLSDKQEGLTYPPFHPNCRTTTVPADEIDSDETRLARGADGRWHTIPASMTYKQWRETMVEGTTS